MTDIVVWLRGDNDWPDGTRAGMLAAAAEIERLRAALREYACTGTDHPCGCYEQFLSEKAQIDRLRTALQDSLGAVPRSAAWIEACRALEEKNTNIPTPNWRLKTEHLENENSLLRDENEWLRAVLRKIRFASWQEMPNIARRVLDAELPTAEDVNEMPREKKP